jgi:hypothetical protein
MSTDNKYEEARPDEVSSRPPIPKEDWRDGITIFIVCMAFSIVSPSFADESLSVSGRLDLRGVYALDDDSVKENPSLIGRVKIDTLPSSWRFHSWLEGGWDGTVRRPPRDHSVFKNYDNVYQSNSPYLEFKEIYIVHSSDDLELKAGIQRFAWGRLDEYPPNDLLNPWDYTQFILKPLEDRKIGVPSVSAMLSKGYWTHEVVWVPALVPYRLPMPDERWAGISTAAEIVRTVPNAEITPQEPDLPDRTFLNGNFGLRVKRTGDIEWAFNLFHGFDPRPQFKTTSLSIMPQSGNIIIDPGYVSSFHRITSIGLDAAAVRGDLSIRAETAYAIDRYLDIRHELWGYPTVLSPGVYPLNPIEQQHDTLDYGIGVDYRLFEDGLLTLQAQQTIIFGNVDALYERKVETILWANVRIAFMNQKIETNLNVAYNPEHGDYMAKANGYYVFSDFWKSGLTAVSFNGPPQSIFGRYSRNDQLEAEVIYSW